MTSEGISRLRFRHAGLKTCEAMDRAVAALKEAPGVTEVVANLRTGSVLVLHRGAAEGAKAITAVFDALVNALPEAAAKAVQSQEARRYVKAGLLTALGGTLVLSMVNERVHIAFGLAFATLVVVHVAQNRRTLAR